MKKLITIITVLILCFSCGVVKPVLPPATDTTVVHVVDSVAWHDSTVLHHVYKEIYNDYADLLDTLSMSTSYSDFSAWVDTTQNVLKGKAENKDIDIPVKIKWKEKIVYKDSIQVVREPYPVEVTKEVKTHFWYERLLWILSLGFVSILIYKGIQLYKKYIVHAAG